MSGEAPIRPRQRPKPTPLARYGQNHLVDGNILSRIIEQAAVEPDDVVLEVGPADGQLTRPLLDRAAFVHAIEIDRRFSAALEGLAAAHGTLGLQYGDALRIDLAALQPAPTLLAANLAYNIAIPLIMTTIATLPSLRRWAVMVQRELAERLFAAPRTKAYSAVSVLVQTACVCEHVRAVPPSAFRPRPRVDSSFVTFRRREPAAGGDAGDEKSLDQLVRRGFGQRRKRLSNSLVGATVVGQRLERSSIVAALAELGMPEAARPEELTPEQWLTFVALLGGLVANDGAER